MRLELTEKQVAILSQLLAAKNDAESKANLVIQTLAAGAGIEAWEGVELNVEEKSLSFKEPPLPPEPPKLED